MRAIAITHASRLLSASRPLLLNLIGISLAGLVTSPAQAQGVAIT